MSRRRLPRRPPRENGRLADDIRAAVDAIEAAIEACHGIDWGDSFFSPSMRLVDARADAIRRLKSVEDAIAKRASKEAATR
ncbi:MAG: hypothetical protein ACF8XB_12570 [Planctomycetota bacterium JB042]